MSQKPRGMPCRFAVIFDDSGLDEAQQYVYRYVLGMIGSWTLATRIELCSHGQEIYNPGSSLSVHDPDLDKLLARRLHNIDCVFTNSCHDVIRQLHDFVLNVGVGLYSRSPMPMYYSMDPLGTYGKSLAYNAPRFQFRCRDLSRSTALRERVRDLVSQVPPAHRDLDLFPWHSETQVFRSLNLPQSQFDYWQQFQHQNTRAYWTHKPQTTIFAQPVVSSSQDPRLPMDRYVTGETDRLVPWCQSIFVFHSTLGFQAALWQKHIESPALFQDWQGDQTHTIEALLHMVWFTDREDFFSNIGNLAQCMHSRSCAFS